MGDLRGRCLMCEKARVNFLKSLLGNTIDSVYVIQRKRQAHTHALHRTHTNALNRFLPAVTSDKINNKKNIDIYIYIFIVN